MMFSVERQKEEEGMKTPSQELGLWLRLQETALQVCPLPVAETSDVREPHRPRMLNLNLSHPSHPFFLRRINKQICISVATFPFRKFP